MTDERTASEPWPTIEVAATEYATTKGIQNIGLRRVNPDGTLGEMMYFRRSKFTGVYIGNVYSIESNDELGTVRPRTAEFLRPIAPADKRLYLIAKSRAYDLARTADKEAKAEASRDLLKESLAPLMSAYYNMNRSERRAFRVLVLEYLEQDGLVKR